MRNREDGVHGTRLFVRKKLLSDADAQWLRERNYGIQDGGEESGLWAVWSDGYVETLDLSTDPDAAYEAVVSARKLVPFTCQIRWWDGVKRCSGALLTAFGQWRPLLVPLKDVGKTTMTMTQKALSHIARNGKAVRS